MQTFRHFCRTKYIASLNNNLSAEQRSVIEGTPFGWFTMLKGSLKISRKLLSSLISLWVERRGGFLISNEFVRLSLFDVCLRLCLRVHGESINLDEVDVQCECKKLLNNKSVDVDMVYDFLVRCRDEVTLEDYCRLYILLGISEFLCPSRMGTIFPIFFTIVDDLSSLGKYNWVDLFMNT